MTKLLKTYHIDQIRTVSRCKGLSTQMMDKERFIQDQGEIIHLFWVAGHPTCVPYLFTASELELSIWKNTQGRYFAKPQHFPLVLVYFNVKKM